MTKQTDGILLIGVQRTLGNTDFYSAHLDGKHMLRLSVGPSFSLLEPGTGAPQGTPKGVELSTHYDAALRELTLHRPHPKDNPQQLFPDMDRQFQSKVVAFMQQVVAENCGTAPPCARPITHVPNEQWNHNDI